MSTTEKQEMGKTYLEINSDEKSPIIDAIKKVWGATDALTDVPLGSIASLASARYSTDDWTFKF